MRFITCADRFNEKLFSLLSRDTMFTCRQRRRSGRVYASSCLLSSAMEVSMSAANWPSTYYFHGVTEFSSRVLLQSRLLFLPFLH